MWRQEPPSADQICAAEVWCDALLVEGVDAGSSHRAYIRALNTARQAAERHAGPSAFQQRATEDDARRKPAWAPA
jgi:hypothetical protein